MKGIKPLGGLTKTVVVMICIYMFLMACLVLLSIFELVEFAQYESDYRLDSLLLSQRISGQIALIFLPLFLITAIFFMKWIYRVSKNLHTLSAGGWDFSAGGAVGWFFVPIASLFKPYHAMREIWSKAHQKKWGGETKLLPGWWTLWLISIILGQTVSRQDTEIIQQYQLNSSISMLTYLLNIALGFTAIALLSNISRAYEENYCGAPVAETEQPTDIQKNLQGTKTNKFI